MTFRFARLVAAALFLLGGIPGSAAVIQYNTRIDFNAIFPGAPVEDFEEAGMDAQFTSIDAPLDSSTNNGVFSTGAILAGLRIQDNPGPDSASLIVGGPGLFPGTTYNVGSNTFADALDLIFVNGVQAVAFDLYHSPSPGNLGSGIITISVYDVNGLIATFTPDISGIGFFGVSSDAEPITRISLLSDSNLAEFVDNVAFTSTGVPEPSSMALGVFGLAAAALLRKFRRA